MRFVFYLYIFSISFFSGGQEITLFEQANKLYNDGKYAEAISAYESILKKKQHSTELYFNLANAHYKLNNPAPSIYYYEKALLLSPNNKEVLNNLSFAQNMTIDAIDKVPEVGFSRIFKNIVITASTDTWAKIAIGSVFIFVILFLVYHFAYSTSRKRIAFVVSFLSLFLALFSLVMAYQKHHLDQKNNPAIVFAQESRVKADPNTTSEEVFRLHEGTKVQVLETYNDWSKIELTDKSTGWVPSENIKLLNFF